MNRKLGVLSGIVALLTACTTEKAASHPADPGGLAVPVTVAKVIQKTVPVQLRAIGNVQPYSTVAVRSEVTGELTSVNFTEGQDVHKGDLLFVIDPRPFQAALRQAEANLARDTAQAKNAEADARRYEELFRNGIIARQQYDQFRTNADALTAAVEADRAAVENARLQLGYTVIRSPIDGRTGNLLVHQGNLVKANDIALVVINQVQPIYVSFSVPSQNLPEIKRYMSAGLKVAAAPKEGGRAAIGRLTFVDNAVDVATGTIQLKGTFSNDGRSLWPGQFVDVTLGLTTQPNAVLIPSEAVQTGQQGQYVFVVKPNSTVESRPVIVSRLFEQHSVISSGLTPGETVVTDGQLRLAPGAKVRVVRELSPS